MAVLLFDIGGTKTRVGICLEGNTIKSVVSYATPSSPEKGLTMLVAKANDLLPAGASYTMAVGGIRGLLLEDKSGLLQDTLLAAWEGVSVTATLEAAMGVPVHLENDAALAGLGEAVFGAGQGIDLVVYHTISTGVGGAKIVGQAIDHASIGFEPGHQVLDIDRTILGEGVAPTLENLVSGRAVEERTGNKPFDIPQNDVIWQELAGYLAQGLRNTILYWSPEVIILGGSMMVGDPKIPLEAVRKATVAVLDGVVPCPFITTATLGDEAGLYGALAWYTRNKA